MFKPKLPDMKGKLKYDSKVLEAVIMMQNDHLKPALRYLIGKPT